MISHLVKFLVAATATLLFSNGSLFATNIYDRVRNINPNVTQTYTITDSQAAGQFVYRATNPRGLSDDGGLVLKSAVATGIWLRRVENTPENPINLDWFFLRSGADLTPYLKNLKKRFAPRSDTTKVALSIKLPNIETAKISYLDWRDLKSLHLLEPDQPLRIQRINTLDYRPRPLIRIEKKGRTFRPLDDRILSLEDVNNVVIGGVHLNVTFVGLHTGIGATSGVKRNTLYKGVNIGLGVHGLIELNQRVNGAEVDLRINTRNARSAGVRLWGTGEAKKADKIQRLWVAGHHFNSGVNIGGGVAWAHLDEVYVSDPYGVGYGFTDLGANPGSRKNINGQWAQRGRGVWMLNLKRLTGRIRLQFGGCRWFMSNVDQIGRSQEAPFWITSINHHVSGGGSGVANAPDWTRIGPDDPKLHHRGVQMGDQQQGHTGKMDHIGSPGDVRTGQDVAKRNSPHHWTRFLRTTEGDFDWYPDTGHADGMHFPSYSTILEATTENPEGRNYSNDFVHLQAGNSKAGINIALLGRKKIGDKKKPALLLPDSSRNHTIVGIDGMPNDSISLSDKYHTLRRGDWGDVQVGISRFYFDPDYPIPTSDITIKDLKVRREIDVGSNVKRLKVSNVNFAGDRFRIMTIGQGSEVQLNNCRLPLHALIEGDKKGTLIINGVQEDLPFTTELSDRNLISNGSFENDGDRGWNLGVGDFEIKDGVLRKNVGGYSVAGYRFEKFQPHTDYEVSFFVKSLSGSPSVGIGSRSGTIAIVKSGLNTVIIKSGDAERGGLRFFAARRSQIELDDISVRRLPYNFVKDTEEGWTLTGFEIENGVLQLKPDRKGQAIAEYDTPEFETSTDYLVRFEVVELEGDSSVEIRNSSRMAKIDRTGAWAIPILSGTVEHIGLRFVVPNLSSLKLKNIRVHPVN